MENKNFKLLEILLKLKVSELNRKEINYIIEKSYLIALSFFESKQHKQNYFFNGFDNSVEDMAMDSIVPLFIKTKENRLGIYNPLITWNDKITCEADALFFISKLVWKRVDQSLMNYLKEKDPVFAKIIKSLNNVIKLSEYKKIRYLGKVIVVKNNETEIYGKVIDKTSFEKIPESIFGLKQHILFDKIFEYILAETDFHPAIPLNLLVKRVKNYHLTYFNPVSESIDYNSPEETYSVNQVMESSLAELKYKLENYYLANDKIDDNDAKFIFSAFRNIAADMLDGSLNLSLFKYLKDYIPNLERDHFYKKYHPIMNYLLNWLKNRIADKIYF